jgi:hypothetical protein
VFHIYFTYLYLKSCYVKYISVTEKHAVEMSGLSGDVFSVSRSVRFIPGETNPPPYRADNMLGGLHMRSECFVDETIPLLSLEVEAGFLEVNQQCHHCADRDVSLTVVLRSAVRLNQDR